MLGSVPGRLGVMMFLQYFGLAAVIVPLTRYLQTAAGAGGLNFPPTHVGTVYMTFALGAVVTPLAVGPLADRWFAVEKVIAATHAVMAVIMTCAAVWCASHDGATADPNDAVWPLFALMFGYALGTQITLTLTFVISFRNLRDGSGAFWYVRLVGTFGWVVAGVVTGWALNPISPQPLYLSAATSLLMAGFALWLPHTPPKGRGLPIREVIGLPALQLFRDRAFLAFALVLVLGNAMNQFYGLFASPFLKDLGVELGLGRWGTLTPEVVLGLAQVCEMGCMAATPFLLRHLKLKQLMLLGLGGLVLRNALLYAANVPAVVAVALPMHGWGYAFYGLLGSYFVDREAPPHLRAGAQALVTFLGSGPAVIVGNVLAANVVQANRAGDATAWGPVWLVPLVGYVVAFVAFALLFREPPEPPQARPE